MNQRDYFDRMHRILELLPWQGESLEDIVRKVSHRDFQRQASEFRAAMRHWFGSPETGLGDLYALMRFGMSCGDWQHKNLNVRWLDQPWLFNVIRKTDELELSGKLHRCWRYMARGHFKTTTVRGQLLRRILAVPSIRISYYSRTKDQAEVRAGGVRLELEENRLLHLLYPDILWGPEFRELAPQWANGAFTVRRPSSGHGAGMSEATITCYGIPPTGTGAHPNINVFDDVEDDNNAHSSAMARKFARGVAAAIKITDPSAAADRQDWFLGTQYSRGGPYSILIQEGWIRYTWTEPAVDYKKPNKELEDIGGHEPVLFTPDELREYRGDQAVRAAWRDFCLQYLCRVDLATIAPFDLSEISFYKAPPETVMGNKVILVDPAGAGGISPKHKLDAAAILVMDLGADKRFRLVDAIYDRLRPAQLARKVVYLHRKWSQQSRVIWTRVDGTGGSADCETIALIQDQEQYVFDVYRIPQGGKSALPKKEREYRQLEPLLPRLVLPQKLMIRHNGETINLTQRLLDLLEIFAETDEDHIFDALAMLSEDANREVLVYRGQGKPRKRKLGQLQFPSPGAQWVGGSNRTTLSSVVDDPEGYLVGLGGLDSSVLSGSVSL